MSAKKKGRPSKESRTRGVPLTTGWGDYDADDYGMGWGAPLSPDQFGDQFGSLGSDGVTSDSGS